QPQEKMYFSLTLKLVKELRGQHIEIIVSDFSKYYFLINLKE
ncbi:MAG: hypothetical protein ACI8QP_001355, partial [Porticoccaceae bacterium]